MTPAFLTPSHLSHVAFCLCSLFDGAIYRDMTNATKGDNMTTQQEHGQMVGFSTWGRGPGRGIRGKVRVTSTRSAIEAVRARLSRETGLIVVTCRWDGSALDRGKVTAQHYQITMGAPIPRKNGGGYGVRGEVWVAIDTHMVGE